MALRQVPRSAADCLEAEQVPPHRPQGQHLSAMLPAQRLVEQAGSREQVPRRAHLPKQRPRVPLMHRERDLYSRRKQERQEPAKRWERREPRRGPEKRLKHRASRPQQARQAPFSSAPAGARRNRRSDART